MAEENGTNDGLNRKDLEKRLQVGGTGSIRKQNGDDTGWSPLKHIAIQEGRITNTRIIEYLKPGMEILNGLCTIASRTNDLGLEEVHYTGRGATGLVVKAKVNKWELIRQKMFSGDIENQFGITFTKVIKNGEELSQKQIKQVDDWLNGWKQKAEERGVEFPEELEAHISQNIRDNGGYVAVKMLKPAETNQGMIDGETNGARFDKEGHMMKYDVKRPDKKRSNVAEVYVYGTEVDEQGNPLFKAIVEELVQTKFKDADGKNLSFEFDNLPLIVPQLSMENIIDIVDGAYEGIHDAHEGNIVIRDVSLKNVIPVIDGNTFEKVRIVDFGLAKLIQTLGSMDETNEDTTTGSKLNTASDVKGGTPYYASPEELRMLSSVGFVSDMFSLGSIMYETITQKRIVEIDAHLENTKEEKEAAGKAITSRKPEDDIKFVNESIALTRDKIKRDAETAGAQVNEEDLPQFVSDEVEDICMLLLEKNETFRIDDDIVAEKIHEIKSKKLYQRKNFTKEELTAKVTIAGEYVIDAQRRESVVQEGNISGLLDVAKKYEEAAKEMLSMYKGFIAPSFTNQEVTREDAWRKAKEHYAKAKSALNPETSAARRKEIDKLERIAAAHERLEHRRADQYHLVKVSQKQKEAEFTKIIEENREWIAHEGETGLMAKLSSVRHGYGKQKETWEQAVDGWVECLITQANQFRKEWKFNASARTLQRIKEFLDDNVLNEKGEAVLDGKGGKIPKNPYSKYRNAVQTIDDINEETEVEIKSYESVEMALGVIASIEREMDKREFSHADSDIANCLIEYVSKVTDSEKRDALEKKIAELKKENKIHKKAYGMLKGFDAKAKELRKAYGLLKVRFAGGELFSCDEIIQIESDTGKRLLGVGDIPAEVVGEEDYNAVKTKMKGIRDDCKSLKRSLYGKMMEECEARVATLEAAAGQDLFQEVDLVKLAEGAEKAMEYLHGEYGIDEIDTDFVEVERVTNLNERAFKARTQYKENESMFKEIAKLRKTARSEYVSPVGKEGDEAKAAMDSTESIVKTCIQLVDMQIKEKESLELAKREYESIPEEIRNNPGILQDGQLAQEVKELKDLFKAYDGIDPKNFVKKTPAGLTQQNINAVKEGIKEYRLAAKPEDRNDVVLDRLIKDLCEPIERAKCGMEGEVAYERFKEIAGQRKIYDEMMSAIPVQEEVVKALEGKPHNLWTTSTDSNGKARPSNPENSVYAILLPEGKRVHYEVDTSDVRKLTELKRKKNESIAHFGQFVGKLIQAAEDELGKNGVDQPRDNDSYQQMAFHLTAKNPKMAIKYFNKYSSTLPDEAKDERAIIESIVNGIRNDF